MKLKLSKPIGIGLVLAAAQLSALCGEIAVLRNGFTIRCERKEQAGSTTRLYTREGFLDIPTAEIASFEPDDTPDVVPVSPAATNASPAPASTVPGTASAIAPPAAPSSGTAAPATHAPLTRSSLDEMVREASSRHQIDPDFVNSVIKAESNFQPRAISRKGAQGLMQLMPGTAFLLGVADPFDPQANVEGGTAYLSQLLDLYHDDPIKALAAYNAGPHRVEQYHGVPPYMETRAYVARIVRDYNAKKRAQMKAQPSPAKNTTNAGKPEKKAAKPQPETGATQP